MDIRVRDGEEESMPGFLAYATGRVVGPFCETQTTGRRAGSKVWLWTGWISAANAQSSGNVPDICLFIYKMRITSCVSTYLNGCCGEQDKTCKRTLKRTYYQLTVIIIKIKALTLSFSCCQMQKAHFNFIFETVLLSLFLVIHSFFIFWEKAELMLLRNSVNSIYVFSETWKERI